MSERKEPHPFKAVRRLLRRIPDPRLRMSAIFAVFFAINLVAGRVVETIFDKESLEGAYRAQSTWIAKLKTFTPLELGKGYLDDFGPAMRGDILYKPPAAAAGPSAAAVTAALQEDADRRLDCMRARVKSLDHGCMRLLPAGETASTCTVAPSTAGCETYLACAREERREFFMTPPECAGLELSPLLTPALGSGVPVADAPSSSAATEKGVVVPGMLAPIAAFVRTMTRLFSGGAAAIVPFMQLGLGVLGAFVVMRDRKPGRNDGDGFAMFLMSPVVVILIASLGALALKWLMIGALAAFAGVTQFAATAAGATGFVGACWYCFAKLAEKGVEGAMTGKIV
ncbi:MAG: hypothetical protein K2Q06_14055 [Parvularculaceae bacterium]|nr:hypothetical protein [Parvularculaceae bacterium]